MFRKFSHGAIILAVFFILSLCATGVYACTSVVVGKSATVDGSVLTSHTCDGTYEFRITVVPAADHAPGAMRPVYTGGGSGGHATPKTLVGQIPQVAHTYQYFDIAYPFGNANQVMMGETTIGSRSGLSSRNGLFQIWELERVGLERAKTAREAIQIMGAIAEQYGYIDGGECLTIVDGNEAWFFEIHASGPLNTGAIWAAQRIPDNHVGVSANRGRIGQLGTDPNYFMYSSNVHSFAQEMGWWSPADGPLHFSRVYSPKESLYNSRREWRVLDILAPSYNLDPWEIYFPFSVVPDAKVSVEQVMNIKRDHYEGTEFDLTQGVAAGPFGTPDRWATSSALGEWERAISLFRCSYVIVMQTRSWLPSEIGGVAWFGEDVPQSTCYIPIYCGVSSLPSILTTGARNVFSRDSAWWAFQLVGNYANLKYSYMIEDIKAVYTKFESYFLKIQPAIETVALDLYKQDPKLAIDFLTNYTSTQATSVVNAWWDLFDTLVVKYQDGYVARFNDNGTMSLGTVGYPMSWLDIVEFDALTYR